MIKFYQCKKCGKIVEVVKDSACNMLQCCNQPMEEIVANTTDAAVEKHVPEYTVEGGLVNVAVGSAAHPMMDVHYIEWICVETSNGYQIKYLQPETEPKASFVLADGETVSAVYAYCNLHGLWKK